MQASSRTALGKFAQVRAVAVFAAALLLGAAALITVLCLNGHRLASWWVVAGLALVAAVAERGRVNLPNGIEVSISLLPALFAAVVFGPLAAMVVGAASFLGHGRPYLKVIIFTSARGITWGVAAIAAGLAASLTPTSLGGFVVAAGVGALASQLLDMFFTSVTYRLRGKGRMRDVFRTLAPLAFAAVPFFAPVVVLLAVAYREVSPLTLVLFFVPALGAQRLFVLYQEQRQLACDFADVNKRLEKASLSFATALVAAVDARDPYTAGHSAAVAIYAKDIAERMGLPQEQQDLVHLCGLVHDIGKIGLPPGLLDKPGALTLEERRLMERHSEIGESILRNWEIYPEIAAIVRHHHERWDGEGYPDKLEGAAIPLLSRIIAVADAYNAMTSDRPYRDAMPSRVARMRLAQAVEAQFDTSVVAAFEAVLAGADEAYRAGTRGDFSLESQHCWSDDLRRAA